MGNAFGSQKAKPESDEQAVTVASHIREALDHAREDGYSCWSGTEMNGFMLVMWRMCLWWVGDMRCGELCDESLQNV
jgi:hypothetical protein